MERKCCARCFSHSPHRETPCISSSTECIAHKKKAASKVCRDVKDASDFYWQNLLVCQREILCSVAAMLLMMPETVAFSYAANVDPLNGLYATGFLGIVVSLLGGVPATMAGAAGAVAMVMPTITSSTGILAYLTYYERLQHLFVAVTQAGMFEPVLGFWDSRDSFPWLRLEGADKNCGKRNTKGVRGN
ncbi:hypothetical protein PsorP6_018243 [Peronosclerospora sorghi]|uniref:Uncharacterized protein n=1 Tax=Peronosclerospora sorghi TaxID=230839 RepID=A0ACC0WD58_9STRA|nr:hypothetical protein PsorP6_018243 [Peronosclerospora sorghi]